MRILITGGNGFIASNLIKGLQKHELTILTRSEFDLRNTEEVDKFFKNKSFDYVLHTATSGGSRLNPDNSDVLSDNMIMFYNLLKHKNKYRRFINFGSGAELDRRDDIDLSKYNVSRQFPTDPYGMSKNLIARIIENLPGFQNVRIFAVFGEDEIKSRFIRAIIENYIKKQPLTIHQNKLMDFFYIEDFIKLINYIIDEEMPYKEMNCVYSKKYSLFDIANIINELDEYKSPIHLGNEEFGKCYIGNEYPTSRLPIEFIGLEGGIKQMYKVIKNGSII